VNALKLGAEIGNEFGCGLLQGLGAGSTLDLSGCQLGSNRGVALLVIHQLMAGLTSLDLSGNDVSHDESASIATALGDNCVLTQLKLDGAFLPIQKLRGGEYCEALDLSYQTLGDASGVIIAKLLEQNYAGGIMSVNLLGNRWQVQAALVIARVLSTHETLKTLCGLIPYQHRAEFVNMHLCAADAILLAADVQNNSVLRELDLSDNSLGHKVEHDDEVVERAGPEALGFALQMNTVLQVLDLSRNYMDESSVKLLNKVAQSRKMKKSHLTIYGVTDEWGRGRRSSADVSAIGNRQNASPQQCCTLL